MSSTFLSASREAQATATAQRLMAQFVTPLFEGVTTPAAAAVATAAALPSSKAHQRAVKPAENRSTVSHAPDSSTEPSGASFGQRAAQQVKAWRKVKQQVQQRQRQEALSQPAPPEPFPLTELLDREAVIPRRGKGAGKDTLWRYAQTLYRLATEQYRALKCQCLPHQMSFFSSNEFLAQMFEVNLSTIYRWNQRLKALGFLEARAHYASSAEVREAATERKAKAWAAKVAAQVDSGDLCAASAPENDQTQPSPKRRKKPRPDTVVDGMVFAIRFRPGHQARIHIEDLQHQYRNLDADRATGRTAFNIIKQMKAEQPENLKMQGSINPREEEWFSILRNWAVGSVYISPSLEIDPCILDEPPIFGTEQIGSVDDVIQAIGLIRESHPTRRAAVVDWLAQALCVFFGDPEYHRAYCKMMWQAWREEQEGRNGLQVLMAQLSRINTDRREWAKLRKPGALLMSRMRRAA